MKKTINKIMCLLAVLVLCLPMLNLCPVSAEELEEDIIYPPYYGIECFEPHEDGSGFQLDESYIDENGTILPLWTSNYIETGLSADEYHSQWCHTDDDGDYYVNKPYYVFTTTSGTEKLYNICNIEDEYTIFLRSLRVMTSSSDFSFKYSASEDYYYATYFVFSAFDKPSWNETVYKITSNTLISTSPLYFKENSDGYYYLNSESTIYYTQFDFVRTYYINDNYYSPFFTNCYATCSGYTGILFDDNIVIKGLPEVGVDDYTFVNYSGIYSNCDIDTSMFSSSNNFHYGGISDLKHETVTLSEQIDVKLTPEFGLDMDRTFDPLTGQDDYFKFEVTNNSETSIQFCLSIKDRAIDVEKGYEGQVIEDVFQGIGDWENAHWNYITDTYYYADSVDQIKRVYDDVEDFMNNMAVLVPDVNFFPDDYIRYAELQKGNFYWVLLNPGETYEDYIYWSNVNIEESKSYSFICDVVPTSLEYPTDIFYYVDEETGTKYYAPNSDLPTSSYHLDIENTTDKYAVKANDCYRVCNYIFSVYSVPTFSSTVVGGNSAITSGWDDTVSQADNPYYRYNTSTESMIPVSDYSAFMPGHANGGVADIDFDNVGINDVKNYIKYSQGYFELLRSVFQVFPAVWVLIVFGLGAIIVIAIIRFIKG